MTVDGGAGPVAEVLSFECATLAWLHHAHRTAWQSLEKPVP